MCWNVGIVDILEFVALTVCACFGLRLAVSLWRYICFFSTHISHICLVSSPPLAGVSWWDVWTGVFLADHLDPLLIQAKISRSNDNWVCFDGLVCYMETNMNG